MEESEVSMPERQSQPLTLLCAWCSGAPGLAQPTLSHGRSDLPKQRIEVRFLNVTWNNTPPNLSFVGMS